MNLNLEIAKQLNFFISSCRLYDEGRHEEAIRIALVARVLFHETTKQRSLILSHCKKADIKLRSTTMLKMPIGFQTHGLGFLGLELNTGNFRPMLDESKRNELLPFKDWWEEPIVKLELNKCGETVTRQQMILLAAEKDGGAHVDKDKPIWYERLVAGLEFNAEVHMASGKRINVNFKNANLAALRQIGHELLTSEELTCLAQK